GASAAAASAISPGATLEGDSFWRWLATEEGAAVLRWLSTDDGPAQLWLLESHGLTPWGWSVGPGDGRPAGGARERGPAQPAAQPPARVAPEEEPPAVELAPPAPEGPGDVAVPPEEQDEGWARRAWAGLILLGGLSQRTFMGRSRKAR